jgi:hypothetical protein
LKHVITFWQESSDGQATRTGPLLFFHGDEDTKVNTNQMDRTQRHQSLPIFL